MEQDVRAQWVAYFEASGLTQDDFTRQHGIPGRTLREWRRKFRAGRQPPAEQVKEVVDRAIEALIAIRARLNAARPEAAVDDCLGFFPASAATSAVRRRRPVVLPVSVDPNLIRAQSGDSQEQKPRSEACSGVAPDSPRPQSRRRPGFFASFAAREDATSLDTSQHLKNRVPQG